MNEEMRQLKLRKLKKWEEYRHILLGRGRSISMNSQAANDPREAELRAVKMVYPGDKNSSTTLRIWKKYRLWPPSEKMLSGKALELSRNQEIKPRMA